MLTRTPTARTEDREQGFTLIELLVVIIIIGILAAIAIPVFTSQRQKGLDASLRSDLKNAATAAETISTANPTAATFGADNAAVRAAFAAQGFKEDQLGRVQINGSPAAGYCMRTRADEASTSGMEFFWYDSRGGGLLKNKYEQASLPAGGACAGLPIATGWRTLT